MSDSWLNNVLDRLRDSKQWGYRPDQDPAVEPAALAALTLMGHGRLEDASGPLNWLVKAQRPDGRVCSTMDSDAPGWGTSMSIVAWATADRTGAKPAIRESFQKPIDQAFGWLMKFAGKPTPRNPETGHDTELIGWPWIGSTHSWLEPTSWAVLAMKAAGRTNEPRYVDGLKLLFDRLLPSGGANYGNTIVLGQELLPHVQPTGLAVMALAGVPDQSGGRLPKALNFLQSVIGPRLTSASLAYAWLGLAAHRQMPAVASELLADAAEKSVGRGAWMPRVTMLTLAALGSDCPIFSVSKARGAA